MPRKRQPEGLTLPKQVPKREQALEILKECLRTAGLDPDAFDILTGTYCLIAPGLVSADASQYLPCYVVVAKSNGMAFLFPVLGKYGIDQRHLDKMKVN